MNRLQVLALAVAALNLTAILLFPPYDYISLQRGNIPTFAGFYWVLATRSNLVINSNFLSLEVLVIAINSAIAWLLLRGAAADRPRRRGITRMQRGVLWVVAINLVAMLLFPPFENFTAITKAVLPTFDGFYFVFGDNSKRQLVTPILYIEIALVLINGALAWLLFSRRDGKQLSPTQLRELAQTMQEDRRR